MFTIVVFERDEYLVIGSSKEWLYLGRLVLLKIQRGLLMGSNCL
jgi:hypothetical protein